MAKAKKQPSEKQIAARKAFGEAARARALKNKNPQKEILLTEAPEPDFDDQPRDPGPLPAQDYGDLQRQILELKAAMFDQRPQNSSVEATSKGLIGSRVKYAINPNNYPDPRERLALEQRLQRFAFSHNYEITWDVGISEYTTIDNVRTKEPKFTIELVKIMVDEDTGDPTNGRYVICKGIFHEDPEAAIIVANQNGLEVDQEDEKAFLDEMRYLRIRDWLLEAFYPPKPQDKKQRKEMVINGKLVDYYEVNSETTESIPFAKLQTKL